MTRDTALDLGSRPVEWVESLLRELPSACWRELARGPRPEPDCRLCETMITLDYIGMIPEGGRARVAAVALLDYHEIDPDRLLSIDMSLVMAGVKDSRILKALIGDVVGQLLYHRCQIVYEIARRLDLEHRHSSE